MVVELSAKSIIFNTRPIERASSLTEGLRASGHEVLSLPLLTLSPRRCSTHDELLMRRWCAGRYAAVVVVSPTAAMMALECWRRLQAAEGDETLVQPSRIIAVGEATAAVLSEQGLEVEQPLDANNEGMLQMPLIASLKAGDRLLMWRGLGGRRLLVETLRQRGVEVDSIAWYQRLPAAQAYAIYKEWLLNSAQSLPLSAWQKPPVVLISSGASFEHWRQILLSAQQDKALLTLLSQEQGQAGIDLVPAIADFVYLVLGQRLAAFLQQQQLQYQQVEYLDPETLLTAISRL